MSTFFQQTAQAMIAKHIDHLPLLKLDQVIDWQPIEQYLNRQRTRYLRDHRGHPAYPLLSETFEKFLFPDSRNLNTGFWLSGKRNFSKVSVGYGKANQVKACDGNEQTTQECLRPNRRRVIMKAQGTELNTGTSEKVAGPIGPAPLYDTNYPYSLNITGNPTPALPAQNLQ